MLISTLKACGKMIAILMIVPLLALTLTTSIDAQPSIPITTCAYNDAVVGLCDYNRTVFFVDELPGDKLADWFTTYSGTDYACQREGFVSFLCTAVTFDRPDDSTTCVNYRTFRHCTADAKTDTPIIVVVEGGVDCVGNDNGNISCKPGTAPPLVEAPFVSFTG